MWGSNMPDVAIFILVPLKGRPDLEALVNVAEIRDVTPYTDGGGSRINYKDGGSLGTTLSPAEVAAAIEGKDLAVSV